MGNIYLLSQKFWEEKVLGHDEDLREPLVRRQGSQFSMRVARGSASWLSPCSDSSATPSFPSQPEGKIGLPRANPRGRLIQVQGFPGGSVGKEAACSARDMDAVPGSG